MRSSRPSSSATSVEARHQLGPDGGQAAGQAPGGAAALEGLHVDAVLGQVDLGQALEPAPQQLHLGRGGALLRSEHLGRVEEAGAHVAGHHQLDAPQPLRRVERPQGAQAPVGGGRAAHARRCTRRAPSSTAAPISSPVPCGGGADRVVALGARRPGRAPTPAPSRSPPAPRRSRHPASTGSPRGPVTVRGAVGAHRARRGCPRPRRPSAPRRRRAQPATAVGDRPGDRGGRRGALELVGSERPRAPPQ